MAYALNKSDNGLLITLEDGVVDTTTTGLTLIGRNAPTFGERQNENFIRLLENFARETAPGSNVGDALGPPMIGQLWYNVTTRQISVYTGTGADNGWKSLGGLVKGLDGINPGNLKQFLAICLDKRLLQYHYSILYNIFRIYKQTFKKKGRG